MMCTQGRNGYFYSIIIMGLPCSSHQESKRNTLTKCSSSLSTKTLVMGQ